MKHSLILLWLAWFSLPYSFQWLVTTRLQGIAVGGYDDPKAESVRNPATGQFVGGSRRFNRSV